MMKDSTTFADLLPRTADKPKTSRATFSVHIRYRCGTSVNGQGTKRDCIADFEEATSDPRVEWACVERSSVNDVRTIREYDKTNNYN